MRLASDFSEIIFIVSVTQILRYKALNRVSHNRQGLDLFGIRIKGSEVHPKSKGDEGHTDIVKDTQT